jgi:cellulose synthase/poly-beta-1,6-N-acetylglucosamine synthase-like glycosyltransferase
MFRPEALRILVETLRDPAVGAATGDVRLLSADSEFGEGESLYYRIERRIQEYESALGSTMGVDGGMYVIRKELYRPLPRDTVLDDFKTSMNVVKANRRLIYEPSAVAIENGTPLSSDEFRRRVRVAAGAAQSVKRGDFPPPWHLFNFFAWFSHKFLRWTGPIWLVVLLVTTVALWNEGWIYRIALGCQLLVYGLTLIAWIWPALRTSRIAGVAFYFTLSHLAIAWGTIKGLFLMQKGTWKRTARTPISGNGSPTVN